MDAPSVHANTTWTRTLKHVRFTDMTSLKFRAKDTATNRSRTRYENRENQMRRGVTASEGGGPAVRQLNVLCDNDSVCSGTGRVWATGPTSHADPAILRPAI